MTPGRRRLLRTGALGAFGLGLSALYVLFEHRVLAPDILELDKIDRPLPRFSLPGLGGGAGFTAEDAAGQGRPLLLNVFASWCPPCAREAPLLMALRDLPIWGVAYKDRPDDTAAFLRAHGDPYARIARDDTGVLNSELGLAGVPETFLIDRFGMIRWHWAGGLTEDVVARSLRPVLGALG